MPGPTPRTAGADVDRTFVIGSIRHGGQSRGCKNHENLHHAKTPPKHQVLRDAQERWCLAEEEGL